MEALQDLNIHADKLQTHEFVPQPKYRLFIKTYVKSTQTLDPNLPFKKNEVKPQLKLKYLIPKDILRTELNIKELNGYDLSFSTA